MFEKVVFEGRFAESVDDKARRVVELFLRLWRLKPSHVGHVKKRVFGLAHIRAAWNASHHLAVHHLLLRHQLLRVGLLELAGHLCHMGHLLSLLLVHHCKFSQVKK